MRPSRATLVSLALAGSLLLAACGANAEQTPPTRIEVDAHAYPWSPIGRLNAGGRGHCTGFLISEQEVLTAAHCLYDSVSGRWRGANELHFIAAYQREDYSLNAQVERYEVSDAFEPKQPAAPENALNDWAILRLKKPLGKQTGWYGLQGFSQDLRDRLNAGTAILLHAGYERRRAHVITMASGCRFIGKFANDAGLAHDCPVEKGDSGSPLLVLDRGRISVVGIHVLEVRLDEQTLAGVLSLDAFRPEASSPMTRLAAQALKDAWGPGQRPPGGQATPEGKAIARIPLKVIDRLLHRSGFLPSDRARNDDARRQAIAKFQRSQKITRDGQASLQLLELLLLAAQSGAPEHAR